MLMFMRDSRPELQRTLPTPKNAPFIIDTIISALIITVITLPTLLLLLLLLVVVVVLALLLLFLLLLLSLSLLF